jgi:hypothetical protein
MSNQDPGSASTTDHLEIVGRPPRSHTRSARRYVVALVVAALGAGAVGAGVWAWQSWAKQGPQPAEALPGNTLAYAALDLDPTGGQKLAAYNTLRKFPSLRKELGLGSADDLTKSVVDELASDGHCDLDYGDVKPWIGDRVAVAVVAQARPEPVVVLQVKDADLARTDLKSAVRGCDGVRFGYVVDGEWAVLARNEDVAAQVKRDADRGNLGDDKEFRALTGAAGDPGLVTLYAAPEAGKALLDEFEKTPFAAWTTTEMLNGALDPMTSFFAVAGMSGLAEPAFDEGTVSSEQTIGDVPPKLRRAEARLNKRFEHFDELTKEQQKRLLREQDKLMEKMYGPLDGESPHGGTVPEDGSFDKFPTPELDPALRTALQNFTGLGGVARFADSGLELEVVGDSLKGAVGDMYAGSAGDAIVSKLPADTAVAFGVGFADGWVESLIGQLNRQSLFTSNTEADTIKAFEKATGLDVPGDVEALGGEGISVVAGSGFDPDHLFEEPAQAPVAVRISGDPDRIEAALDKLRTRLGADGGPKLLSRRVGDDVVVGLDAAYLKDLAKGGDNLGGSDLFHKVVPDAEKATTVYFMNFDAGDWLAKVAETDADRKDVEPLEALGATVTKDKGEQRVVFRLSFDD